MSLALAAVFLLTLDLAFAAMYILGSRSRGGRGSGDGSRAPTKAWEARELRELFWEHAHARLAGTSECMQQRVPNVDGHPFVATTLARLAVVGAFPAFLVTLIPLSIILWPAGLASI